MGKVRNQHYQRVVVKFGTGLVTGGGDRLNSEIISGLAAQVVREALEQEQESDAGHGADLAWISEDGAGDDWP